MIDGEMVTVVFSFVLILSTAIWGKIIQRREKPVQFVRRRK